MSEAGIAYLGMDARSLNISDRFDGYSRVVLNVADDLFYEAGNDTGRTLTIDCPWGTQEMADNILASVQGYSYQPYETHSAHINPATEIGDGITATGMYGGIVNMGIKFGRRLSYTLIAPHDEEVDHEYEYVPSEERKFSRSLTALKTELRTELRVETDKITASAMTKTGGSTESFGWTLNSSSWKIDANGSTVLSVDKSGLSVSGKVTASSGTIGGFTIGTASIYNKISSLSDTTTASGVYIGTDGIRLGKNFSVSSSGTITASGGTFSGTIRCDALYVKNSSGGYDAISTSTVKSSLSGGANYNNSGWNNYSAPTIATYAGYGKDFNNATKSGGGSYPGFFRANVLSCDSLVRGGRTLSSKVATIDGSIVTIAVWN